MKIYEKILGASKIIYFIAGIFLLTGLYSFYEMPKQEFPEIEAPAAVITTIYPGATAQMVKREVTDVIENQIIKVEDYDYSSSTSRDSVSNVVLRLDVDADVDKAYASLSELVDKIRSELPSGVREVLVKTDLVDTADAYYLLINHFDAPVDPVLVDRLEYILTSVEGTTRVDVLGDEPHRLLIEVDLMKANAMGLSLERIYAIIEGNLRSTPIRNIQVEDSYIDLSMDQAVSREKIENIVIFNNPASLSTVQLKEIAEVLIDPEPYGPQVIHSEGTGVLFSVYFNEEINVLAASETMEEALSGLALPPEYTLITPHFSADIIKDSLWDFSTSFIVGIVLVMLTVFFGMGLRNAAVVSAAIPMTLMISFTLMNFMGMKIHQISIAALIISLGMLVDNAIVIIDSVQVRIDEGQSKAVAVSEGVGDVSMPVLTSTLTTVFAFLPLLVLSGVAGEYIHSLPLIIMITLLTSYGVSVVFTPVLSRGFLVPTRARVAHDRFKNLSLNLLKFFLHRRKSLALVIFITLALTVWMGMSLGLQFFPYADSDIVYVNLRTNNHGDFEKTLEEGRILLDVINGEEGVDQVLATVGRGLPKFYNTLIPITDSVDVAQFYVDLDLERIEAQEDSLGDYLEQLKERLDAAVPGSEITVNRLEQGEPIGNPIRLIVTSHDPEELHHYAELIKEDLKTVPGVKNVSDDAARESLVYDIAPSWEKMEVYGITEGQIRREIALAVGSMTFDDVEVDGVLRSLVLKGRIDSVESLEAIALFSPSGVKVPLRNLVDITIKSQIPQINQYERLMAITISADLADHANPLAVESRLREIFTQREYPVAVDFDGETAKILQYFGSIGILAIYSLMLILIILIFQFNSFKKVLLILLTIPLASIGSIWGLWIFGLNISFMALFGMVSLFGIVVNNAIVLLDYINKEIKAGDDLHVAVENAVAKRFRPIMLTTITTVFGLIPLAVSGSTLFVPMAIALIFGLSVSTLLTLIVIPVIFTVLFEEKDPARGRA